MLARHDVTEARGGLHLHLAAVLGRLFQLVQHSCTCVFVHRSGGSFYSLLLCATTPSPHSQHMLKAPRIGGDWARLYLAQTMLNFLRLGESRFLLMILTL